MSTEKNFVVVTNINYNKDSYYLVRFTVKDKSCLLKSENNQLTKYGIAVKQTLERVNKNSGRVRMVSYIITPYYTEFVILSKHRITDIVNKGNRTLPLFLSYFKKLSERAAGAYVWQSNYAYRKLSAKKELAETVNRNT